MGFSLYLDPYKFELINFWDDTSGSQVDRYFQVDLDNGYTAVVIYPRINRAFGFEFGAINYDSIFSYIDEIINEADEPIEVELDDDEYNDILNYVDEYGNEYVEEHSDMVRASSNIKASNYFAFDENDDDYDWESGETLSRKDFYKIAQYVNENWRGFFSRSGLQTYADEYYADYMAAVRNHFVETGSPLDGLITGLVEDWNTGNDTHEIGNWLETMAYDLGFRDFEELIREFTK